MSTGVVQILIGVIGGGGLSGSLIALLKVKPEKQTAAISQAQGAMETMQELNKALNDELNRLREICNERQKRLEDQDAILRQLRDMVHGAAIMDDDKNFPPPASPEERTPSS